MKPMISPFTPDDIPALDTLLRQVWTIGMDALREECYGRPFGVSWQDKIVRSVHDYIAAPDVHIVKAHLDHRFAGFMSYRIDQENRFGEIGYNAVCPSFQGHGIGRLLLEHALNALRAEEVENVEVITGLDEGHAAARRLYEKAGFLPMRSQIRYTLKLPR